MDFLKKIKKFMFMGSHLFFPIHLFPLFFIIFTICCTAFLFGCNRPYEENKKSILSEEENIPVSGDRIILGSIGDAKRLLPMMASDSSSGEISGLIHNGLVKYDKDIKVIGDLAESWDISHDGLVITFYLRRNVKWHDGKPFTAHDCLFTYQKMVDPNVATPYSQDFLRVKDAKILDDYTFQVTYEKPFAPALISLCPCPY
jgi:peptide/nickel transport system substrate-binding protein